MNVRNYCRLLIAAAIALCLAFLLARQVLAASVTLAWDYGEEQQANISGFKLYRTHKLDDKGHPDFSQATVVELAPSDREHRETDLQTSTTYFWVITAYDTDNESGYSNEVSYTTPATWSPGMEVIKQLTPKQP
jgi:hypothetical protein